MDENIDHKENLTTTGQHADNDYDLIEKILKKLNKSNDFSEKTCIDVGCGNGTFMKNLSDRIKFKSVDGIEVNKFAIDNLNQDKLNPFNNLYNSEILNFQTDFKYDFCIFTEVLEHLYDDEIIETIHKLKSISKNIIITTPDPVTCFQLGFYLGELKLANQNSYLINNIDEFRGLEAAVHKSTVMKTSMRMSGFKTKTIKWNDNNINLYMHTILYYGETQKINPQRINHYGLQKSNYSVSESSDFKKIYMDILIDSAQFFPKFNKKFNLWNFIVHQYNKRFK